MRRCRGYLVLVLLLVAGSSPADEQQELLQHLAQRLSVAQEISGEFYQEKHVSFLQNPFVSRGNFSLSRVEGLSWHVTDPLDSLMRVRGGTVTLDGNPVNDFGVAQLMTRLMFAFMEGDFSDLGKIFAIEGTGQGDQWHLTLVPKDPRMKAAFERVDMRGDHHLREVEVFEAEGNRTKVQFTDVRASGPAGARSGTLEPDGN